MGTSNVGRLRYHRAWAERGQGVERRNCLISPDVFDRVVPYQQALQLTNRVSRISYFLGHIKLHPTLPM
jgi:hypothetical protein